jgi:flagellar biogenesis protein FliO
LGGKKALCLVEVQGRQLLLGVSSEAINLLCEFDSPPGQSFEQTLQNQNRDNLK